MSSDTAPAGDGTYRRLTAAILVAHQQGPTSQCLCGRLRLGDSWADHVAEVLDAAGALRNRPSPRQPKHDVSRPTRY